MEKCDLISKTNSATKYAWERNWEGIDINTVMTIFEYPRVKEMLALYKTFLTKEMRILEAGCGIGPWVIRLTKEGYDITGIDYDAHSIMKIKSFDDDLKVYAGDVRSIPFPDNCFDAYLSFGVLEHFREGPQKALKEAYRILARGGVAIITVPYKNFFVKIKEPLELVKRNNAIRHFLGKPKKIYYYQKYFSPRRLSLLIASHGFKIEKVMPLDHIFSLVSFLNLFRDRASYDGENGLAVSTARWLKLLFPWASAHSSLIVAHKT